jgi:hypothetical protein
MCELEAEAVELEKILLKNFDWEQVCRDVLCIQCIWEPEAEAVELATSLDVDEVKLLETFLESVAAYTHKERYRDIKQ